MQGSIDINVGLEAVEKRGFLFQEWNQNWAGNEAVAWSLYCLKLLEFTYRFYKTHFRQKNLRVIQILCHENSFLFLTRNVAMKNQQHRIIMLL